MVNYDEKTGIHFDVISPNSICQETLNDLCDKSTDTIYEESKNEMIKDLNAFCDNHGLSITYCLPREFFDSEYSKIPYRYYRVDNDKEEITPIIEVK